MIHTILLICFPVVTIFVFIFGHKMGSNLGWEKGYTQGYHDCLESKTLSRW